MSTVNLQLSSVYPAGTSVSVYAAAGFSAGQPTVSALQTVSTDSSGVAAFTGLTPGGEYVVYSSSNGRYVEFTVPKPSGDGRALVGLSDVDVTGLSDGQVLVYNASTGYWTPGTGTALTIKDEGSSLTQRNSLNFTGAGVTATDNSGSGRTDVTIPGAYNLVQDEGSGLTARTTLNFTGAGVTAADNSGSSRTDITIPGAYNRVQDESSNLTQRTTINFTGAGVVASDDSVNGVTTVTISGGGTTGYANVQDEGSAVTQRTVLNFVGSGVTVTDDSGNSRTTVTIPGATSGYTTVQEEGAGLTARSTLNFIGPYITAADNSGSSRTDVTVSVPDAASGTKGVVQLTGDLGGTAASPTVPNLISKTTATTKGDLLAATAASTITRLGVGSDGQVLTASSGASTGLAWAAAPAARSLPTFAIAGSVSAATIPGFFVSIPSGRTKKLLKVRYKTSAGTVTFKLQKNGSDITGFGTSGSPLSASSTAATTDPTDVTLSEDDYITLVVVSSTSGADLSVTCVLEES